MISRARRPEGAALTFDAGLYALDGVSPEIAASAWIAPGAQVMGRVALGDDASVWYGAVLRGDNAAIAVGARTNIQDGCILHTDDDYPLSLGADVTVGHRAVLHGCTIEAGCLIGMGACVMNGAVIGEGSIIGAGALVTEGTRVPPRSLMLGMPAGRVRDATSDEARRALASAAHYVAQAARHRDGLTPVEGR